MILFSTRDVPSEKRKKKGFFFFFLASREKCPEKHKRTLPQGERQVEGRGEIGGREGTWL